MDFAIGSREADDYCSETFGILNRPGQAFKTFLDTQASASI